MLFPGGLFLIKRVKDLQRQDLFFKDFDIETSVTEFNYWMDCQEICADIHGLQTLKPTDFDNPFTSDRAPPAGPHFDPMIHSTQLPR